MTIQHYTACDHLDLADADLVSLDGVSHPERAAQLHAINRQAAERIDDSDSIRKL